MHSELKTTEPGRSFDPIAFLATPGHGRTISGYRRNKTIIAPGDISDSVFYIIKGKIKLTFVADDGRAALFAILGAGDFFGGNCLVSSARRTFAASTVTESIVTRLNQAVIKRLLKEQPLFSELFISFLLRRVMRMQADIVNHLINSSQKRLARLLVLLACDQDNPTATIIPHISHEMLAEMVGTTRSRINSFMNEFRRSGFIDYNANGNLRVDSSLAQVLLGD
jgi:CRP/FNR family cyclic AMP-dependent transcriptional regulator